MQLAVTIIANTALTSKLILTLLECHVTFDSLLLSQAIGYISQLLEKNLSMNRPNSVSPYLAQLTLDQDRNSTNRKSSQADLPALAR